MIFSEAPFVNLSSSLRSTTLRILLSPILGLSFQIEDHIADELSSEPFDILDGRARSSGESKLFPIFPITLCEQIEETAI